MHGPNAKNKSDALMFKESICFLFQTNQILFLSLYISNKELLLSSSKFSKFQLNGIFQFLPVGIIFIFTLLNI